MSEVLASTAPLGQSVTLPVKGGVFSSKFGWKLQTENCQKCELLLADSCINEGANGEMGL